MAEQEVIKHTRAVYKTWKNPNTGWKHKLKDTLFDILIIVFAITLSMWLHNWNERKHSREEARSFLEGLKTDLANDTIQLHSDLASYVKVEKGADYFKKVSNGEPINKDSLDKYVYTFYNSTRFNVNMSRYEALKTSGKLNIVENTRLLNDIINYYQQTIYFLNMLNDGFTNYKTMRLGAKLDENLVVNADGTNNWEAVLRTPAIKNALRRSDTIDEIKDQYNDAINQARNLLKQIDKELQQ